MNLQQLFLTKNECYAVAEAIKPNGIVVHSTGANNPNIKRYVGPNDGLLGHNANNNHWNVWHPGGKDIGPHSYVNNNGKCAVCGGRQVCVHGFIGKIDNGQIATYQTLPWDIRSWHSGSGSKGNAGRLGYIGFEICEDNLTNKEYFDLVYQEAIDLCVYLCRLFNLTAHDIIDHSEGHKLGIASNHADVMHWFPRHGKSMDTFRAAVNSLLNQTEPLPQPPTFQPYKIKLDDAIIYKGPGTDYPLVGTTGVGTFTIIKEQNGWGKLKSGVGWIMLNADIVEPIPEPPPIEEFKPFTIKLNDSKIHDSPAGIIIGSTGIGTFTIIEKRDNWGKLKSGVGWVLLPNTQTLSINDIVYFYGNTHYSNSNAATGKITKPGQAKITAIKLGTPHPYHIITTNTKVSNVFGWVDANSIQLM